MATIFAILDPKQKSLDAYADAVNSGTTSDVYYYVNGNRVSVSNPYRELTEGTQIELLDWFLNGKSYKIERTHA